MFSVQTFACHLNRAMADALNRESGRIYTNTLVWHYRLFRRSGHWCSCYVMKRIEDALGGETTLHAHSRDAAQEGFYAAAKTARALRNSGFTEARYPHKRKYYRTTTWKTTGIRTKGDTLVLARARGLKPIVVSLPSYLVGATIRQVELVYDKAAEHYRWHVTVEDGITPSVTTNARALAVDLGEIHPATLSDGEETLVLSCRELRASKQYVAKRVASIQSRQDRLVCAAKGAKKSRLWRRLQRRKTRFKARETLRQRDMEHKLSRAVVDVAEAAAVGVIAIGDVRDIADGKRLTARSQQKIARWSHGKLRRYIETKAAKANIATTLVAEAYTSQTCPCCGSRHKPRGRVYSCVACGFRGHRDGVGAVNILSRHLFGDVGKAPYAPVKYRRPYLVGNRRSSSDTGHVARE